MTRATASVALACFLLGMSACDVDELGACDVGFIDTRPYIYDDPAILLCRACDDECSSAGDPCDTFGDVCDFSGEPGLCGTCCDEFIGKLRCYPRER